MVPPGNRRTGYSRRAQNNVFFAYVATLIGVVAGGALLVGSLANSGAFRDWRSLASDVTQPAAQIVAQSRVAVGHGWAVLAGYATWGSENAQLKREVALARVEAVQAAALADENRRLKAMLKLSDDVAKPIAHGWLVASTNTSPRRYATISVGSGSGVAVGMPVRTPLGLIGRVLEVGHASARVLMITDTQSVVPVRRARDGIPAFATGKGDGTLQLRLLTLGINPLKVGDAFVTSGSGGLYWPGTPIAVVSSLTRDGAIARVLGDPAASEMIAVVPSWQPDDDVTLPPPSNAAAPPPRGTKPAKNSAKPAKNDAKAGKNGAQALQNGLPKKKAP